VTGLSGVVTGIRGDATGIRGNIDDCQLTDAERKSGLNMQSLVNTEIT